jgi:hypothetical protein
MASLLGNRVFLKDEKNPPYSNAYMTILGLSILQLATLSPWLTAGLDPTSPGQAVVNFIRFRAKTFIQGFKTGTDCAICTQARRGKPDA